MVDLSLLRQIHVIGVGGAGMSAIAEVLATMGHRVSGSDKAEFPVFERLRRAGVTVHGQFDAANIGDAELVAVSTAWLDGNAEVEEARRRGIPVLRRAQALAAICALRRTIAVAGTHGKTTTCALLATVLLGAGLKPSFIVGAALRDLGTGARWDDGEWLVVEADESDGTFLELPVEVAVVTSLEPDHLEHWGGFPALVHGFHEFVEDAPASVVCADDPGAAEVAVGATTYGFSDGATVRILAFEGGRDGARFQLDKGEVTLPLPGRHNALNAVAAITAAAHAGVPFADAAAALAGFGGVARRFDRRGEAGGITYVDEYAHLPTEVKASIAAALEGGWRRVVAVFQPHRYSRTAALWQDFAHAFDGADVLAVTDVYSAGEPSRPGVTGKLIVDAVLDAQPHRRVAWLPTRAGLTTFLRRELRAGDLCLTLGAGDLTTLPSELLGSAS